MKVATVALGVSMASAAGTGPYLTQSMDCNDVNGKAVPTLVLGGFLDKDCKQGIPFDEATGKQACTDMMAAMKKKGVRRALHQHEKGEKKDDMDMKFVKCTPKDKGGKMILAMDGEGMQGKKCDDMAMMGNLFNAAYMGVCADSSSECPAMQNMMFVGMNMGTKCEDVTGGLKLSMSGGMFIDKECKKAVPGMGKMMCMAMAKDMNKGGSGGKGMGKGRRALQQKGSGGMTKGSGGMGKKKMSGSGGMMKGSGGMGKKDGDMGMKCMPSKDGSLMVISMFMPAQSIGNIKCAQLEAGMKKETDKEKNMFMPQCNPNDMDMKEKKMMGMAKKCYECEAAGKKGCGKIMDGGEPDKPKPKPSSPEEDKDESSATMAFALGAFAVVAMLF